MVFPLFKHHALLPPWSASLAGGPPGTFCACYIPQGYGQLRHSEIGQVSWPGIRRLLQPPSWMTGQHRLFKRSPPGKKTHCIEMCTMEKVITQKITWFIMMFPLDIIKSLCSKLGALQPFWTFPRFRSPWVPSQGNLLISSNISGGAQQAWWSATCHLASSQNECHKPKVWFDSMK